MASRLWSTLRCVTTTPFGELVDPAVYCTKAVVFASTSGATHSAAPSGVMASTAHHCREFPSAKSSTAALSSASNLAVVRTWPACTSATIDATRPITRLRTGGWTGTATAPAEIDPEKLAAKHKREGQ